MSSFGSKVEGTQFATDQGTALNIRVTLGELASVKENVTNRVQVDNGDYAGVLGAYHFLHCLNNLRRIVHWNYFEPRLTDAHPDAFSKGHSGKLLFLVGYNWR